MSKSSPDDLDPMGQNGAAVIQVTPGQIVGAAAFLLGAAVVIFIAGMVARDWAMGSAESTPPSEPEPELERIAVVSPPDPPMPEPESIAPQPDPPIQQTLVVTPREAEEPAPLPKVSTVDPEPNPEPVEPEPVTDPPAEDPAPEETTEAPVMETGPTLVEEPAPAPVEAPPPPEPLPATSANGAYTVQVLSIGITKRAQAEAFQLESLENKDVQVELVESADGKRLRAYVGTYATRAEALAARERLLAAGFDGCFIKRRDD